MFEDTKKLIEQISLGEDSFLEFKEIMFKGDRVVSPHRNSIADELSAMANSHQAVLLCGISDKSREIVGIPIDMLDSVETWLRDICNDLINPPLDCTIQKQRIEDKIIIRIDVPKSLFIHQSPNGYFHRIGSSKRQMTPDILARLFQQRSQARIIRYDENVVPRTTLEDLDSKLYNHFKTVLSDKDSNNFLLKMKLISLDYDNILRPTISGILMCCNNPEEFLSNAFIQAVLYRGTEKNGAYQLDAKDITGPLDVQIKEASLFVERNMRVYATKNPYRIERPQYSINAIFEAIVNAVAHRDYSIYGSKIRLHIFSNRVEIFSPGAIPNTMTIESLSERQSARNELISSLLARSPMNVNAVGSERSFIMDKRGEGVPIIITESEKLSGIRPVYELLDDSELKLTIFATPEPNY